MLKQLQILIVLLFSTLILGCTTTDPYTGESRYDPDATAALVGGLAVAGLAAYAASSDDEDDRHEHHRHHSDYERTSYRRGDSYSPHNNVKCYDYQRACYHRGDYSERWTRREYGERYW